MRAIFFIATVAISGAVSAQDAGNQLNLICGGEGSANQQTTSSVYAWGNGGSGNVTVNGTRSVGFGDEVALWIEGGEGRLRMPRAMLPPIRGGENGWFKLKSIVITDR